MSSSVEKIKERIGIVEVISSYLKLEKAGTNYKAKCPFHNEKTASFFVSPDRGSYYCFGCGAKGDIFSFVEEFEGIEFTQALAHLALKAGVELVPEKQGERDHKQKMFDLMDHAALFFVTELPKYPDVLSYLKGRGLTDSTIKNWKIGYAPNEWRSLYNYLVGQREDQRMMNALGLTRKNEKGTGEPYYDTFRGRIMFPLSDQSGRVVAFSGRVFADAEDKKSPKYVNSPETELFYKSEFLYGLDKAKMAIRKQDYSIVVEGQFDLIMSHQAGFLNTVASSGTALTERHIKRLQSLSNRIMFAFDSDGAGFAATERSAHLALSLGMEVKVATLPKGDDPASLIQKDPKAWGEAIAKSKHIIDFYTDSLVAQGIDSRNIGKMVKEKVLPFVLMVQSAIERSHFIKNISEKTNIREESIWDDLKHMPQSQGSAQGSGGGQGGDSAAFAAAMASSRRHSVPRALLGILLWQESMKTPTINVSDIAKRIEEKMGGGPAASKVEELRKKYELEKEELMFETEQYYKESPKLNEHIEELFSRLEEETLKEELTQTIIRLKKAEQTKDSDLIAALIKHCQDLSTKLAALKNKL